MESKLYMLCWDGLSLPLYVCVRTCMQPCAHVCVTFVLHVVLFYVSMHSLTQAYFSINNLISIFKDNYILLFDCLLI